MPISAKEFLERRGLADLSLYWPTNKPLPQIDYESGEAKPTIIEMLEQYAEAARPSVPQQGQGELPSCPNCGAPSLFTTETLASFEYGLTPPVAQIPYMAIVTECAGCHFKFTDCRSEERREYATKLHLALAASRSDEATAQIRDLDWR